MNATAHTEYDTVPYPSALYPQTHPDRLATIATLFGLNPARLEKSRVLELGCGDGTNLITMAFTLPESQFYGIDLASEPIRRGNEVIRTLGLSNITLRQMDLLQTPADLGRFDFIIVHGLYSWVPAEARDKILAICGAHLTDHGVAYVSYNAYPGNHLRDLVRQMMRFHVQQFSDPTEKIKQARALVKLAAEAKAKPGLWQSIMAQQLERIARYTDSGFYHDDLSVINQPVYFFEFAEHAARHGLQYLAEAEFDDPSTDGFQESVMEMLRQLEGADIVAREQYVDFLKGRSFRQTLLCRQEIRIDRALTPERALGLFVSGETRAANPGLDVSSGTSEDFHGPKKAVIATSHPIVKAALVHLGTVFPQAVGFDALLAVARERCGCSAAAADPDRKDDALSLAEFLVRSYVIGFVELHIQVSPFVTHVSERPVASALARLQLQRGESVSTLRHVSLRVEDPLGRQLIRLLDGTRDHAALVRELSEMVKSGKAVIRQDGKPLADPQQVSRAIANELEANLLSLARSAILVA